MDPLGNFTLWAFVDFFFFCSNFVKATPCAAHLATYLGTIQPTDGPVLDLCGCHSNCLVLFATVLYLLSSVS